MDINQILDRLKKLRGTGANKWVACCPAHDDQTSSLAITLSESGDKLLLKCWAGCGISAIVAALHLELRDLFANSQSSPDRVTQISRRQLFDALETELLILALLARKRAQGEEVDDTDSARESIAWQRIDAARSVTS